VSPIPILLDSNAATAAIAHARGTESVALFNHSVRSFLFAELLAQHDKMRPGLDYDQEAVFFGCVLHDLGAGAAAHGAARFEVEGADLAATLLTDHGYGADFVDLVWDSIALHTSGGIAERRGPVCYLVRGGVGMDFGRNTDFIDEQTAANVHDAYPRLHMEHALADAVIAQAGKNPAAAPSFSMPAVLLRERQLSGTTQMELEAAASRWGD
jgi:hypothetical protein